MKKILIVGAVICCVIGIFWVYTNICGIIEFWPDIFLGRDLLLPFSTSIVYLLLTFKPTFILIRSKASQMSRLKLMLIGFTELIDIGSFLAVLFLH